MSKTWPDHLLEEIRTRADIVGVVSDYVVLEKKGKNYLGLCPFHYEKTPSFTVTPDKQMFYCFGCQTGGSVFTFVMKKENITFAEAVKLLAERAGVSLPEGEMSQEEQAKQKLLESIARVNKAASDYYHESLLHSTLAQAARDYLARRGIERKAIEAFHLGFAADGWSFLTDFLLQRGFSQADLLSAGLATSKESDGVYDRFRNRIIFPIVNVRSQIVGFGGRVLGDSLPKYLNSPETPFFSKGHNLYGINLASKVIREKNEALVVEGYMDVITAHQSGFSNAVASLGTALTKDQAKLIQRYTHNVLLAYDADPAGINATWKGADILRELGCKVRVLTVPAGKDPDEFLRSHRPEEFDLLANNAPGYIEYKLDRLIKERPAANIGAKVEIVSSLSNDIVRTESLVEREGYIRLVAKTLGITEEVIYAEIRRISLKSRKSGSFWDNSQFSSHTNVGHAHSEFGNPGRESSVGRQPPAVNDNRVYRAENLLLGLMLNEAKVVALVEEKLGWDAFRDPLHIRILGLIRNMWVKGNWSPGALAAEAEDEALGSELARLSMKETGVSSPLKAAADCIKAVKDQQLKEKIDDLQEQARLMQNCGDVEGAIKLLQEINSLIRQ